jgi:hypothetical protein
MSDKKLIRVELEFDDGSVQSLEGEQAQEWMEVVNGYLGLQQLRQGYADGSLAELLREGQAMNDAEEVKWLRGMIEYAIGAPTIEDMRELLQDAL